MRKKMVVAVLVLAFSAVVACSTGSQLDGKWKGEGDNKNSWWVFKGKTVSLYDADKKGDIGNKRSERTWEKDPNNGKINIYEEVMGTKSMSWTCTLAADELDCGWTGKYKKVN